ncbi:hypothetical protein [Psychrobacter sp. I-STPA10]|uniref:hypothetical protein n=1 Tax=Psychrobacter sp. I-STPA10 TaxID=2585769 RepID=UPI001E5FC860|nr:hypothetical protein [Psychrobacter sp. I-STPA10]
MKLKLSQHLLILRDKILTRLTLILTAQKSAWLQCVAVICLFYAALVSMAFIDIIDTKNLNNINSTQSSTEYKGVVTVVDDEAVLKTLKTSYILYDPKEMLHKSPYFTEKSQLQSFRICVHARRSVLKEHLKGSYTYKLTIKNLC